MDSSGRKIRQTVLAVSLIAAAVVYTLITIARLPDGQTITNEAISAYLFKTGQRVTQRSNMTETVVQSASIAVILELNSTTSALVGNGSDSCVVTATVFDAAGNLVPDGQPVSFTTTAGRFLNDSDTTYTVTVNGSATAILRSSLLTSGQSINAEVTASTFGASGQFLSRQVPVVFYSAAIAGTIRTNGGVVVQGVVVTAINASQQEAGRDSVEEDGKFLIPITVSGEYAVVFRYRSTFGDDISVRTLVSVEVPVSGGVPAVSPLSTIIGYLTDASSGQPLREANLPVLIYHVPNSTETGPGSGSPYQPTNGNGMFEFDSLTTGTSELHVFDVRFSGKLTVQHPEPGSFILDANIALATTPTFEITKTSNKRIAEIGDAVTYAIDIKNLSVDVPLTNIRLFDELPHAFVLVKESGRLNGRALPEPLNKRKLEWFLGDSLLPQQSMRVTYSIYVGAGALESDGINKAYASAATATGQTVRTAEASSQVTVRPGVFTDRGIVIGKVFYDTNENAQQDDGENGIAGVELWMEDGTRITTGDGGKYSLPEVRPGQHVLRVNENTLPYGAQLLSLRSESAGDGSSRFLRLVEGGIVRTDFYVRPASQANLITGLTGQTVRTAGDSIFARYRIEYFDIGAPLSIQLTDTLGDGYWYDLRTVSWRNTKLNPDGKYAKTLLIDFPRRAPQSVDTVDVMIVADTAGTKQALTTQGRLTLHYAYGKDAVFVARPERIALESVEAKKVEAPVRDTVALVHSENAKTVKAVQETVSLPITAVDVKTIPTPVKKQNVEKKPGRKLPTPRKAESKPVALPDTIVHKDTTAPVVEWPVLPLPEPVSDSTIEVPSPGTVILAVEALLVALALILLWRRRKSKGEQY